MPDSNDSSPYRAPDSPADSNRKSPGFLMSAVMIVLTVLAGVCTFFVTCFGVGMLTGAIIGPLGFVAGFAFGAYASVWVVRKCSSGMDAGIRQASDTGGNLGSDKQATNDGESGMKQ